jgi:hypothetical protein
LSTDSNCESFRSRADLVLSLWSNRGAVQERSPPFIASRLRPTRLHMWSFLISSFACPPLSNCWMGALTRAHARRSPAGFDQPQTPLRLILNQLREYITRLGASSPQQEHHWQRLLRQPWRVQHSISNNTRRTDRTEAVIQSVEPRVSVPSLRLRQSFFHVASRMKNGRTGPYNAFPAPLAS